MTKHEIDLAAETEAALKRLEELPGALDDVNIIRMRLRQLKERLRQLQQQLDVLRDDPDDIHIRRTWA